MNKCNLFYKALQGSQYSKRCLREKKYRSYGMFGDYCTMPNNNIPYILYMYSILSIDIPDPVGLNGMTQTITVKTVLQHNKLVEIAKILNSHQKKPIRDRFSTYFLIFFIFSFFNLLYNS